MLRLTNELSDGFVWYANLIFGTTKEQGRVNLDAPPQKQKSGGAYTLASYADFSAVLRTLLRFTKHSQSNLRHSCWQTSLPTRIDLIITDCVRELQ